MAVSIGLIGRPEPGPPVGDATLEPGDPGSDEVGRNGEADADGAATAREDGRVDTDQAAIHGDQGTTGVSRIDCGVGLDERDVALDARGRPGPRRDDAAGHRLADAERVADRQHQIADLDVVGITQRDDRQRVAGRDLEKSQIAALVTAHQHRPDARVRSPRITVISSAPSTT